MFFHFLFPTQELKQTQLNEYSKMMQEVEGERIKLQEKRAEMEVSKQLHVKNNESTISRAEIDAAVKYAEVKKKLKGIHLSGI